MGSPKPSPACASAKTTDRSLRCGSGNWNLSNGDLGSTWASFRSCSSVGGGGRALLNWKTLVGRVDGALLGTESVASSILPSLPLPFSCLRFLPANTGRIVVVTVVTVRVVICTYGPSSSYAGGRSTVSVEATSDDLEGENGLRRPVAIVALSRSRAKVRCAALAVVPQK